MAANPNSNPAVSQRSGIGAEEKENDNQVRAVTRVLPFVKKTTKKSDSAKMRIFIFMTINK